MTDRLGIASSNSVVRTPSWSSAPVISADGLGLGQAGELRALRPAPCRTRPRPRPSSPGRPRCGRRVLADDRALGLVVALDVRRREDDVELLGGRGGVVERLADEGRERDRARPGRRSRAIGGEEAEDEEADDHQDAEAEQAGQPDPGARPRGRPARRRRRAPAARGRVAASRRRHPAGRAGRPSRRRPPRLRWQQRRRPRLRRRARAGARSARSARYPSSASAMRRRSGTGPPDRPSGPCGRSPRERVGCSPGSRMAIGTGAGRRATAPSTRRCRPPRVVDPSAARRARCPGSRCRSMRSQSRRVPAQG